MTPAGDRIERTMTRLALMVILALAAFVAAYAGVLR